MRYPIAIEPGDEKHAFGVVVPDVPGCFSAGDTLDEAISNAKEAIELWLETVIEDGGSVPEPSPIDRHQANPEFAGWIWAVVDIDLSRLEGKTKRINITIPENVLTLIDEAAKRAGESRSGFLAKAALDKAREAARQ
jgi:predicted RNase H-like HicB family nuclease